MVASEAFDTETVTTIQGQPRNVASLAEKRVAKSAAPSPAFSYYNFDKIYSYNATFNFLVGSRGLGKTYGAKLKVLKAALKRGDQFIYMRRYKEELQTSSRTFFADIEDEFPDWDFRANGWLAEMAPVSTRDEKKRVWKTIGYFIPLSRAQAMKSVAFPNVKTIIFDEFIIEKGMTHYLPAEAESFQNFYSTVDRWKDKTKVFFLANSVSIMNPYFLAYDIKPDEVGELFTKSDGFILCHFVDAKDFSNEVYQTKFGKFIAGTGYADYAVGSEFKDNGDALIRQKSSDAKYIYTIETAQGIFSVWSSWSSHEFFIQERRPKDESIFTMLPNSMDEGKTFIQYNDRMIQVLRTAWRNGSTYFDNSKSRNAFTEIFKR